MNYPAACGVSIKPFWTDTLSARGGVVYLKFHRGILSQSLLADSTKTITNHRSRSRQRRSRFFYRISLSEPSIFSQVMLNAWLGLFQIEILQSDMFTK